MFFISWNKIVFSQKSATIQCAPWAEKNHFSAPALTVGETEGAMDSASVFFFASSFAYNFVRK